jgi:hypothetical protein
MNLSFSTKGWHDSSFEDFCHIAEDLGFKGIELHNIHNHLFTDKDGAIINAGRKDGQYAYNMLTNLVEVYNIDIEVTPENVPTIRKQVADNIAQVYFYERKRDGYSFQEFRKPNAVEKAQYASRLITESEGKA